MKRLFYSICSAAILISACTVEKADQVDLLIQEDEVFIASIECPPARVYVDDQLHVLWNADDRVSIFNRTTYNQQYRFDGMDGDNSGTFKRVPTDDFVMSNPLDHVYSVYPYNENTTITDGGELTVCLPAEQSYREGTFGLGANTMIAVADDNELMFKNLCGYLTLRLYGTDVSVTSITLKGNRNEPLAGKATVTASLDGVPSLSFDETATDGITVTFDSPVILGATAETATTFWLVVPPTTFEAGIAISLETSDGKGFEKRTTGSLAISRNIRSRMAALEVVPRDRCLTFTSEGTTTLSMSNNDNNAPLMYYSTDKKNWTQWDYSELTFTREQPLYIYGDNPDGFSSSYYKHSRFVSEGDNFSVSGDVMSLIDEEEELSSIPSEYCFYGLFRECTGLTSAPELPAMTLADHCYSQMFYGCTSLTSAPVLPAMTLANCCYDGMFRGCTSLTGAPELPAMELAASCYGGMFYGCTSLTSAPELPATTLVDLCYDYMFSGCTSLTVAPELPAMTLACECYDGMFSFCTSLTVAPELPATTLVDLCYEYMFGGCTSLTVAPELPATTLVEMCYWLMFSGCSHLNQVKCLATDITASRCVDNWLFGVASTGTFIKAPEMRFWGTGASGIPEGWTVEDDNIFDGRFLTFTSEGTTKVNLKNYRGNAPVLYYSTDKTNWTQWDYSELTFTRDRPLYICGDNPNGFSSYPEYSTFKTTGDNFGVSGDVMSLLDKEHEVASIPSDYCFYELFLGCSGLTVAPELPATKMQEACYGGMFSGCTSLAVAPELPARTLAENCYSAMFSGCTSLTVAPDLPATTMQKACYEYMFSGCTSLTSAPVLPAMTLANCCYYGMFRGCTSLTDAPDLPATTLTQSCYSEMFYDCTSLTGAPDLPATTLAQSCYSDMFYGCTSLTDAPDLPATTLAQSCYSEMFRECKNLTSAPHLPATTLTESCYACMFYNCWSLTSAPELPATTLARYCYSGMFYTTSLTRAPDLPARTLSEYCYQLMFAYCRELQHVKCLATDISANACLEKWLEDVASTGTFIKAPGMNAWPVGMSGIPEGWTVLDDGYPEAVDLGLPSGIKWASFNLGASSPEEYGDYYAWGETEPYYAVGYSQESPCTHWRPRTNLEDPTITGYNWASYKWCMGSNNTLTKYCTDSSYGYNGFTDGKTVLDLEDDAAHVALGGKWRMPTDSEWTELREYCTLTKTSNYNGTGVAGRIVTSNVEGYKEKSIFLPATGYRYNTSLSNAGNAGNYWSSSLYTGYLAWAVYFGSGDVYRKDGTRGYGRSVRPVYAE